MNPILIISVLLAVIGAGSLTWAVRSTVKWRRDVRRAEMERDDAHTIKNDFVAMVSHELRTPLTSIAGFAETLGATWEDISQPEVDEFLSIITEQASILGELVEDILVIPRLDADRLRLWPEVFDLSNRTGLVNVLVGQLGIDEAIQQSSIPGLDVLCTGPIPPNPSELLASQSMRALLQAVTTEYEWQEDPTRDPFHRYLNQGDLTQLLATFGRA